MDNHHRTVRRPRRTRSAVIPQHGLDRDPTREYGGSTRGGFDDGATRGEGSGGIALWRDLPVLPVRGTVVLPNMVIPLFVDRDPALRAIEAALAADQAILLIAQHSDQTADPTYLDIYSVGTECRINRVLRMPDGTVSVMVQGMRRVRIDTWIQQSPFGRVRAVVFDDNPTADEKVEALARTALAYFERCSKISRSMGEDVYAQAAAIDDPGTLADFIVAQLEPPIAVRQEFLETFDVLLRLRKACRLLQHEQSVLELEQKIHAEVQQEADRGQREYFLREQLKAVQRELGEQDPAAREHGELYAKIEACGMPLEVKARALKEVERMQTMPVMAPEYSVVRSYVDWLVCLPWDRHTCDRLDLDRVGQVLNAQHFGLQRVKDRIIEFIAVRKLAPEGRSPILCFAGPPGVGKTSLGRSIADALGRKFARISLGGVRDEAEIRGHRRTYVGALPGRIIQTMKTVGTKNPVFVLDEIDKLASDYRGDPSAALLEVLDSEQNSAFSDHYLEVPYDLSNVFFILTANMLDTVPAALRDRMEVIDIGGYTEEEKVAIGRQFIVPKVLRDCGLTSGRLEFEDGALHRIIREYTFESGVRGYQREISAIARQIARRVAEGHRQKATISRKRVPEFLGPQRIFPTEVENQDEIGVATGLAWTAAGGDLTTVEVMVVPGHGSIIMTGQLGEVMRESAQTALTFTRSRAGTLGLSDSFYESCDVHVHLPAGSIPKDGPSAGITMAVAMISALTGRSVRRDLAMTGEITLRGRVLPVGGIKEKVLAAYRAGVQIVILPSRNLKDLDDISPEIRRRLQFVPILHMDEVLPLALAPCLPRPADDAGTTPSAGFPPPQPARPLAPPQTEVDPIGGRVARSRVRRVEVVAGS
jgi:ATP-dependent Lon protease